MLKKNDVLRLHLKWRDLAFSRSIKHSVTQFRFRRDVPGRGGWSQGENHESCLCHCCVHSVALQLHRLWSHARTAVRRRCAVCPVGCDCRSVVRVCSRSGQRRNAMERRDGQRCLLRRLPFDARRCMVGWRVASSYRTGICPRHDERSPHPAGTDAVTGRSAATFIPAPSSSGRRPRKVQRLANKRDCARSTAHAAGAQQRRLCV